MHRAIKDRGQSTRKDGPRVARRRGAYRRVELLCSLCVPLIMAGGCPVVSDEFTRDIGGCVVRIEVGQEIELSFTSGIGLNVDPSMPPTPIVERRGPVWTIDEGAQFASFAQGGVETTTVNNRTPVRLRAKAEGVVVISVLLVTVTMVDRDSLLETETQILERGTCRIEIVAPDGDGVSGSDDGCPDDPNKTAPGACGCGTPDTDRDGDGLLDCFELCPDDPNKIEPGACGCGVLDFDADEDGIFDCLQTPQIQLRLTITRADGTPVEGAGILVLDLGAMQPVCEGFSNSTGQLVCPTATGINAQVLVEFSDPDTNQLFIGEANFQTADDGSGEQTVVVQVN